MKSFRYKERVQTVRALRVYGLDGKPTGDRIPKASTGFIAVALMPDPGGKQDARFDSGEYFSIPTRWLKPETKKKYPK